MASARRNGSDPKADSLFPEDEETDKDSVDRVNGRTMRNNSFKIKRLGQTQSHFPLM